MDKISKCREDFPILARKVHGRPLIYLDNAATTQLPVQVMNRFTEHYGNDNANVHRGIHYLSEQSTTKLEEARQIVQRFINAAAPEEIIFTQGTTDGVNLVAQGLSDLITQGDEIVVSRLEHHSNFIPGSSFAGGAALSCASFPPRRAN
jgi:cysteine desulfurase/selenocysteine lyase